MRIITGSRRGRKLKTLPGDAVRPTPDRVKEALFNILQFDLEGRVFLDLFAGSGQIGLEALSRGAKRAVFVDSAKASCGVVLENIHTTGFENEAQVMMRSMLRICCAAPRPSTSRFSTRRTARARSQRRSLRSRRT